jgi:hypothetical protein
MPYARFVTAHEPARPGAGGPTDHVTGDGPDGQDVSRFAIVAGRAGIAAQGVLYVVLAWLTAQIALGGSEEDASGQGALRQLAEEPGGVVVLVLLALGFAAYLAWQVVELAGRGLTEPTTTNRVKAAAKAAVGLVLLILTISVLAGGGGGGSSEQEATATVLGWPGGRFLVALIGLGIIGFAGYLAVRGIRGGIREKLEPGVAQWLVRLGQVGDVARGVAFAAIGFLLVVAAWRYDPDEAGGLDTALQELRSQPLGVVLVLAIAAGFAAWGVFCVLTARRHRRG